MFPQSPEMSSKEASTPSPDRRHAATRETVPQPRHVARLVSTTARPSQRCDVTASMYAVHQHVTREQASAPCGLSFQFPESHVRLILFFHPHSAPSIGPRLRGNSCALQLRIFCFSVSSQKLSATTANTFCAPPEMQALALGADPSRFRVPQLQGQKWRLKKCTYMLSGIASG
jgi:hypothetical protein